MDLICANGERDSRTKFASPVPFVQKLDSAIHQAPVVQTLVSAINWINLYPADSVINFRNTYPLDSDLSGG